MYGAPLSSAELPSDVVDRMRGGDVAAFERVYRAYFDGLYDYAVAIADRDDAARDIVQDVFVRVWEQRTELRVRDAAGLLRYLLTAVRNAALNQRRADAVRQRHADASVADPSVTLQADVDDSVDEDALLARVNAAIEALPDRTREVLVLRWRHQLAFEDIAGIMGVTLSYARLAHQRAMASLKAKLGLDD